MSIMAPRTILTCFLTHHACTTSKYVCKKSLVPGCIRRNLDVKLPSLVVHSPIPPVFSPIAANTLPIGISASGHGISAIGTRAIGDRGGLTMSPTGTCYRRGGHPDFCLQRYSSSTIADRVLWQHKKLSKMKLSIHQYQIRATLVTQLAHRASRHEGIGERDVYPTHE